MNFDDLTENQRHVLGMVAINQDGCHSRKTLASLVKAGLIVERAEKWSGGLTVKRYDVPIHVHIAWCEWCSARQP